MSDSDTSPKRDDRHNRRSRSRSPVSSGCAGETLAEQEERRLAEAAVQVGPPARQPRAAPADPDPPAQEPVPAEEATHAAQAGAPAAPPQRRPRVHKEPTPRARQAAPRPRPATAQPLPRRRRGEQAPPGRRTPRLEPLQPQRRAGRAQITAPTPSAATPKPAPQSRTRPRPWPVRPPVRGSTAPAIRLPQLHRQERRPARGPGGGGRRTGGAGYQPRERGARVGRRQGERPWTYPRDRPGRTQQGERARARTRQQGQWQRGRTGTQGRPEREQRTAGRGTRRGERARTWIGCRREQQRRGQAQGHEQGAKTGGIWAHRAGQGAVSGQGHSQGHEQGSREDTGVNTTGKRAWTRGTGQRARGKGVRPSQGLGAWRGPRRKGGKGNVGPRGQVGRGGGARGDGQGVGQGTGSRAPPQPASSRWCASPPVSSRCQRTTPTTITTTTPTTTTLTPTRGTYSPPKAPDPLPAGPAPARQPPARPLSRGTRAEGGAGPDGRCPCGAGVWRGGRATGAGATGGAGKRGREGPGRLGPGLGRYCGPPGGQGPPPVGGGVWVAELGQLGDHQGVDDPTIRCRAPPEGSGEPGGAPWGTRGPGGPRKGPPGRDLGGVTRQRGDVADFLGGGGRCSASWTRRPTTGSPGPCALPSPTGATAVGTRRR